MNRKIPKIPQDSFDEILSEGLRETRLAELEGFIQHGNTSVLLHSTAVAEYSVYLADLFHIRVERKQLIRGALYHDYFLYDWHEPGHQIHGFTHPLCALKNAMEDRDLTEREQDIIQKHMFPLTLLHPPKYRESVLVCIADKICSVCETFYRTDHMKTYGICRERILRCRPEIPKSGQK